MTPAIIAARLRIRSAQLADAMINVRPRLANRTRSVEDAGRRRQIMDIVDQLVGA